MAAQFRFTAGWEHPAAPGRLLEVLADVGSYPAWWRQVRAVSRLDEDTAHVVCRSFLPYSLDLTLIRRVEDHPAGLLEAAVAGDLDGRCRWTLTPSAGGTRLCYEQEVVVVPPGLARAGRRIGRLLEANHAWMMRGARRGLVRRVPGRAGGTAL